MKDTTVSIHKKNLKPSDLEALILAKQKMEDISWAMKGLNKVGSVFEVGIDKLPKKQQKWLQEVSHKVLYTVVKANLKTMNTSKPNTFTSNNAYKALVTSSGIIGGVFGATAFVVDLTLATKFMMRSIMDIARSEGEDLDSYDTQLACLQVLALGGKSKHDDNLETSYYTTRIALSTAVKNASAFAVKEGTGKIVQNLLIGSSNPIIKLIGTIASRFSIQVSEKFVAQAIPVIGAAGGGAINLAFIAHFQNMAKAHFSIRRLEREYNETVVKAAYEAIKLN